jgi:16S rRNA (adenine1518-N6/adenine1519-N6)-dimethyltransferase
LRALLTEHAIRLRKRHGQHFLVSQHVIRQILARCEGFRSFLEIGPGAGALTAPLTQLGTVVAIEIDPRAAELARASAPDAKILVQDALHVDLAQLLRDLTPPRALISNMPYHITGPLLAAISEARRQFDRAVLMMQKEVGDRVMARVGSPECRGLTVALQSQFQIELVCRVPPGAFEPPPKVDSVVLQWTPKPFELDPEIEEDYYRLIRLAFGQPRKTLVNNLCAGLGISRAEAESSLAGVGLPRNVRAHQLVLADWKRLTLALYGDRFGRNQGGSAPPRV